MPGPDSQQSPEGAQIPVTTGEFPTTEPSTVPERVMSDIRPPQQQAPIEAASSDDPAKAAAFAAIDAAAGTPKVDNTGLEYREENAGQPVAITTDAGSKIKEGDHEGLEAMISGGDDTQTEEPTAVQVSAPPVAAPSPEPAPVPEPAPAPVATPEPVPTQGAVPPESPAEPRVPSEPKPIEVAPDRAPEVVGYPKIENIRPVENPLESMSVEELNSLFGKLWATIEEKRTQMLKIDDINERLQKAEEVNTYFDYARVVLRMIAHKSGEKRVKDLTEQGPSTGGNK